MEPQTKTANRIGRQSRKTRETDVRVSVALDDPSEGVNATTGVGFFDHMLDALGTHAGIALQVTCDGDLHVDDHHTVEDVALTLGAAIDEALGDRTGIVRFGHAFAPMDEALARCAVDLSGRPACVCNLGLTRPAIGPVGPTGDSGVASENLTHFFHSLAVALRASLHIDVERGENDHHRAEAAFKALALALRVAIRVDGDRIRSTKGVL